jgi:hypothetical protein
MSKLWTVIRDNRNREVLWLVGGLAVVIAFASLWTTFDYFARPKPSVNVATGGGPSPTIEVPSSPIIMVPSPTIGWPQPSPPFGGNVSGETLALETGRLIDADKWLLPEPEFGALIPLGGENSLPNSGGNVSGETPALETGRLIDADKWLLPEPEFGAHTTTGPACHNRPAHYPACHNGGPSAGPPEIGQRGIQHARSCSGSQTYRH